MSSFGDFVDNILIGLVKNGKIAEGTRVLYKRQINKLYKHKLTQIQLINYNRRNFLFI